ncbi:FimV/HubP family polar landmark protein [Marinobacter daepoensis]|uniref:FimV/HubP family polar landmark protein n=1 Tax=Marinobacter daepoensis TaxID=262077 RepID=UPI00040843D1|nr:FimV/HubP family polar landmark protein [Marinobacter daepoensis]
MKVRKLAVALALAGGLGSGMAQALGLGEIELQSWLNEPLDAEISLNQSRGVDPGDVFVNVAPESAYERVGLDRHRFLSQLKFEVVTGADGSLAINVSSREPVREPYLNFLLELTWPNGRLMREYSVLVDPPVYAEESGVEEPVSAPATAARQQPATRSPESVRRQAAVEGSASRGYQGDTFGPTGASDTLWTIAQQVRPSTSVSMQQVMLAIQDQNPNAFIDGNINRLKRGEVLRIPSLDDIRSRSRAEANRVVAQQNQEFQSPRPVDATKSTPAASEQAGSQATSGDELRLLVADDSESRTEQDGGSAGGDGDLPGGADSGSAVAMEEFEAAKRENDELNSRVADLQDQVETLQRLLELKNSQLADMQGMAAEGEEAAPVDTAQEGAADPQLSAMDSGEAEGQVAGEVSEAGMADDQGEPEAGVTDSAEASGLTEDEVAEPEVVSAPESSVGDPATPEDALSAEAGAGEGDAAATSAAEALNDGDSPSEQAAAPKVEAPEAQQPMVSPEKAFPGNIIDGILNNPLYQIVLGGGLIVLLLLLLLVARRNASREKEFYDQLNSDEADEKDTFDLSLEDEGAGEGEGSDAIAEAETYVAYGRHDQAAQVLESAISKEPSRTDLRLKLLSVYADSEDRDAFEKQYREVEALDDEDAMREAELLRERLAEAEAMPSIDDLESQLRSDSFGESAQASREDVSEGEWDLSDELKADEFEAETGAAAVEENEFGELESDVAEETDARDDLIEYDLSGIGESAESEVDEPATEMDYASLDLDADLEESKEPESEDLSLDFESAFEDEALAGDDELASEETAVTSDEASSDADLQNDLNLDLDESFDALESELETEAEESLDSELDAEGLDESFLDELDAELDKVAGQDNEPDELALDESDLDDLELDVSDEDLALMEEFSDTGDSDVPQSQESSLDDELGLEDALSELEEGEPAMDQQDPEVILEQSEGLQDADVEADEDHDVVPVASDALEQDASRNSGTPDIDESSLDDEDDFDFLAGTDEAATKLDLARAYIEMGDSDGARDILEEVALEGSDDQKTEAQELLKNLS